MSFLFTNRSPGLSFAQLRKIREFREHKYAQDAAYSLKHSNADPFDLSNEVDGGHIPGTLNRVKFKGKREGKAEKTLKKLRWADRAEKAALKRQRIDSGVWTDEARRALIANLAREYW